MPMLEINWRPGPRELRQFALAWLAGFGAAGGVLAWRVGHLSPIVLGVWGAAAAVAMLGLVAPRAVRPIYLAWMALAFPIGWVVSHLLLAVLFYAVFGGAALVFRLIRRDALHRTFDRRAGSYWVKRPAPPPPGQYFRQF
jgi:hypothetical protein